MVRGRRVEIVKQTVGGVEVDSKECTKCGEVKALGDFTVDKRKSTGRSSCCLSCARKNSADMRKRANPDGERKRHTRWTTKTFRDHVKKVTNEEYLCVSEYRGIHHHVTMRHVSCGNGWEVRPNSFISGGTRCPECARFALKEKQTKTHDEFLAEVVVLVGYEYEVIGKYIGNSFPVLVRHNTCRYEWSTRPDNFLRGKRCPLCAASQGEKRIASLLTSWSCTYILGYRFDGCRSNLPLPFDVAVMSANEVVVLIEYDGEHHSKPVDYAGRGGKWAERHFRKTQRNDAIKTEYCRANNIPLIRIDYTQFDEIEAILDRELSALGVTGKRDNTDNNDITREEDAA